MFVESIQTVLSRHERESVTTKPTDAELLAFERAQHEKTRAQLLETTRELYALRSAQKGGGK